MSRPPKKKDFFNHGKGINFEEFEDSNRCSMAMDEETTTTSSLDDSFSEMSEESHRNAPSFDMTSSTPIDFYSLPRHYMYHSPPTIIQTSHYLSPTSSFTNERTIDYSKSAFDPQTLEDSSTNTNFASQSMAERMNSSNNTWEASGSFAEVMERDDENSNEFGDTGTSSTRRQKCSLCFNHGIVTEKKGHKWKCNFINCECSRCQITKGRQKTMKEQQKLTRDLEKMRLKIHQ